MMMVDIHCLVVLVYGPLLLYKALSDISKISLTSSFCTLMHKTEKNIISSRRHECRKSMIRCNLPRFLKVLFELI